MKRLTRIGWGILSVCLAAGCRTATQVVEVPRVDLDVSHGNRGYLVGTPPTAPEPKETVRQMVETEVEVPPLSKAPPPAASGQAQAQPSAPAEAGVVGQPAPVSEPAAQAPAVDTYIVKEGDSLSKIAARPDIYGNGSQWHRIFHANREALKDANHLRPGMKLTIPRGGSVEPSHEAPSSEGTAFSK